MNKSKRYEELNLLTLKGNYESNLFKIAKKLYISPYNKTKDSLIMAIIDKENKDKFKQEICIICTEEFDDLFVPLKPCGHYIHQMCIINSGNPLCPLCRESVNLSEANLKLLIEQKKKFELEEVEQKLTIGNQNLFNKILSLLKEELKNYQCRISKRIEKKENPVNEILALHFIIDLQKRIISNRMRIENIINILHCEISSLQNKIYYLSKENDIHQILFSQELISIQNKIILTINQYTIF